MIPVKGNMAFICLPFPAASFPLCHIRADFCHSCTNAPVYNHMPLLSQSISLGKWDGANLHALFLRALKTCLNKEKMSVPKQPSFVGDDSGLLKLTLVI